MFEISKGLPTLGCHLIDGNCYFGIYSTEAKYMILKLYKEVYEDGPLLEVVLDRKGYATGDIFHVAIEDVQEGYSYTWQTQNENDEISVPLIDPYARSLYAFPKGSNHYKNIVVKDEYIVANRPHLEWQETIIYEMHVGAFTKSPTCTVLEKDKGTFEGIIAKIPYLKALGVTTLELLPVFKWNKHTLANKHPITQETLQDEWGYNTIAFFALQENYSANKEALGELKSFKKFISALHDEGMEVILDVVYNHTGEGSKEGKVFNFKALAPQSYYKFHDGHYRNDAGAGNTFNNMHVMTKKLILDSLRYWVICMGVDGFRLDLASILAQDEAGNWYEGSLVDDIAKDPILSHMKLIAECWDAKGAYDVGRMPYPFVEWSDRYRDTIRRFVRGDQGMTRDVAQCLMGSEIQFKDLRKTKQNTLHYVTAHDGFTLWDLVSYNTKHNRLNGEDNRDGHNANYSYNCGVEGETQNEEILAMRIRRIKNYFTLLMLSQGVPMILMGDEIGRTQKGNNNAYCHDNELTWMNWENVERNKEILNFVKQIIAFRKESHCFMKQYEHELKVTFHGVNYNQPDWSYYSCSLAVQMEVGDEKLYIIINHYVEPLRFELPRTMQGWKLMIDTSRNESFIQFSLKIQESNHKVMPFSICVFKT